ncbi:hypothetical protein V8G54_027432 [Vigna mungo]|uniref:Protein kinase domain-containing protein n=1 Tax=Vigna mungo TaxID=3915 RepID=A0AAQ3N2G4_VIGMU
MITSSLWEAMHTTQQSLEEVKIAKSLPRICFLSGLSGEEMMMFIDSFPETKYDHILNCSLGFCYAGLKPAAFAALVPNSANKPLQELIEEVKGDHEMFHSSFFHLNSFKEYINENYVFLSVFKYILDKRSYIRLGDFGLAKMLSSDDLTSSVRFISYSYLLESCGKLQLLDKMMVKLKEQVKNNRLLDCDGVGGEDAGLDGEDEDGFLKAFQKILEAMVKRKCRIQDSWGSGKLKVDTVIDRRL